MKRHWRFLPAVLLAVLTAAGAFTPLFAAFGDVEQGMLWPDESHTFLGITVTWNLPKGGVPTPIATPTQRPGVYDSSVEKESGPTSANKGSESPLGRLEFKGPQTTVRDVKAPFLREENNKIWGYQVCVYVDGIFLQLHGKSMPANSYAIDVRATESSSERTLGGPGVSDLGCFVSSVCPLHLNDWTLSVSKEIKQFPDGSRAPELMAANSKTGEQTSFPLVKGAARKIGRFQVMVKNSWEETKAAQLNVSADPDPSIPGRDALLQDGLDIKGDTTLEAILSQLARQYHFEVEWVPYPDHPESVAYLKGLRPLSGVSGWTGSPLGRALDTLFHDYVKKGNYYKVGALHWVDNTHLQVLPENYDKYLAGQEEKKKEAAKEAEAKAQQQAELAKFKKLFAEKYNLQTKIYKLDTLTPVTAKALVDPELRRYSLLELPVAPPGSPGLKVHSQSYQSDLDKEGGGSVCEAGDTHLIVSLAPDGKLPHSILEQREDSVEESIPDDKANALIVKAIPSTQEKIAAMLEHMQQLASKESSEGPPPAPYRISAVLLQGVQAGGSAPSTPQIRPIHFENASGVVKDVLVKVGDIVDTNDPIVRLDPITVTDSQIDLYTQELQKTTDPELKSKLESRIQSERDTLVRDQNIDAKTHEMGRYRVASIAVKPGDHVIAGQQVATLEPLQPESGPQTLSTAALQQFGLRPEDLKTFGIENVSEMGKAIVNLVPQKGESGVARVALSRQYTLVLTFVDKRKPYLIVKGSLLSGRSNDVVLENTMYVEPGKPSLLGITNLRQALILVVRRLDGGDSGGAKAGAEPASTGHVGSSTVK